MPKRKLSVSDRVIADVLSLPLAEGKLLVGYLAVTLASLTATEKPVKVGEATLAIVHAAKTPKVRKPRGVHADAAVEAGPIMEVGD